MEDIAKEILQQLELIRAFTFVIILVLLVLIAFLVSASVSTIILNRQLAAIARKDVNAFADQADDLLKKNEIAGLLSICNDRLETHPDDCDAYIFKAKAMYSSGDYHESKRCFITALELEPSMQYHVEVWLENLDEKIKQHAPRIV